MDKDVSHGLRFGCLIPLTVLIILVAVFYVGFSRCHTPKLPPPELVATEIGKVTGIDGQLCRIEEVRHVRYVEAGCGQVEKIEKALARRILCPNGNNGQSLVGRDDTKFHNETLE